MNKVHWILPLVAGLLLLAGLPGQTWAQDSSQPYGQTYEQWAADWWQWVFSVPVKSNPTLDETGKHAARFAPPPVAGRGPVEARLGVLHGTKSFVLQTPDGQIAETHSISAGLDYPSVGPEHAWLRDLERVGYTYALDDEALAAVKILSEQEGIIPALESAHAVAEVITRAPRMPKDSIIIVNLSGRGDKDLDTIMRELGD